VAAAAVVFAVAMVIIALHSRESPPRPSWSPSGPDTNPPIAAGTSAANITLNGAGRMVLQRWVARRSGVLRAFHVRMVANGASCRSDGRPGYGSGNGGSWRVTTHRVLPDGRPDMRSTLVSQELRPCEGPGSVVDVRQGVVRLEMNLPVGRGQEYATIVRNADPAPEANYTSTNFLYTASGVIGANGRNERSRNAKDVHYGLDPRELVGFSRDGGASWTLPGTPGDRGYLPSYLQEYNDGEVEGQPYYYTTPSTTARRTMVYQEVALPWTIRTLGAYTSGTANGTLTLTVDGTRRAHASVKGTGMLRAGIPAVTVRPGQTVKITASGIPLENVVADTAWGRLLGMHLNTKPWYLEDEPNFTTVAPIYPLPFYRSPEE
jgi:energy-converting hydrogenase Eha subunit A